jgi:acyl carrier protein
VATSDAQQQSEFILRVKRCIIDAIGVKVAPSTIPDDMPLLDKGLGLDSVAILRLVAALEDEFDVEIEDKVIRPELFRSVGTLSQYMAARTSEAISGA